ncbi:hypothetical protein [Kibdelosporangium aridum]|uniref:hypothetical protein n=1 Tax=Kibdelosporangium aridum TaxID=2030 RepID=UPI000524FE78
MVDKFGKGMDSSVVEVNGRPAVLVTLHGTPVALAAIDATTAGIERLMVVANPEKLAGLVDERR